MTAHDTRPLEVLLAALHRVDPGSMWTVDTIRDELDAAQLTASEKQTAIRLAITGGWATPVMLQLGDRPVHAAIPSVHPPAHRRPVGVYRLTGKDLTLGAAA
ncbi:hypothetical protein M3697_05335 [Janibacter melonis]|uniref:hypothetical protein n=1 Tax=Janibacter melonis TaxID=262209 RepID=UPI0020442445|nr:hypothetical protein [Janibacter melonis]MCM3554529.1 hypothetical protein [Janibacter melonis]